MGVGIYRAHFLLERTKRSVYPALLIATIMLTFPSKAMYEIRV